MRGSTVRHGLRFRTLLACGVTLAVLATGCTSGPGDEFSISADEDRNEQGVLEGLTVKGSGFTPNGTVLVTGVLAATGGNTAPYVEEQIQADAEGKFTFERRPMPCPQPADYTSGSWNLVVARDMDAGISGSERLNPGRQPDCRGS